MSDEASIGLVLVEDHVALRRGMELLLGREGFDVLGTADNVEAGYELVRRRRPDVAVIDIELGSESGVELTRRLLSDEPALGVLLYTGSEDHGTLSEALDCGARGFALKTGPPDELRKAIRAVANGDGYVDPRVRSIILARSTTDRIGVLSPREREVLDLLAEGLTGEEIAKRLFLSPETIRTHVRNAMEKLEAKTRAHAIAIALRQGEIARDEPAA
ncbi:MAG: response regulator transcription factor [Actinomycetota bacterium]|nr:response regulator transcription factor [Actinomycetota bacterium]